MSSADQLLVFNVGSSSLKAELFALDSDWRSCGRVVIENVGDKASIVRVAGRGPMRADIADYSAAAEVVLTHFRRHEAKTPNRIGATAHRVVHGGHAFSAPVVVTDAVLTRLRSLDTLAPLHNPPAVVVMHAVRERLPGVPMAAVFDTAFFRDLPEHVQAYAVPEDWRSRHGIRRFGFHGIAHEYLHHRYRALTQRRPRPERVLTLQLGQGCSVAALLNGRAVETSMGYTPLEGLIMGTRPGDLDPGVVLRLLRSGHDWEALENALNRESGLRGLSGTTDDMRELLAREADGDARAALALAAFCHRARKYIGAYAAVLGGVDAVLFGGGIGENAPPIRERICSELEWLGLRLDREINSSRVGAEGAISQSASAVEVYVIAVHEEAAIARAAHACFAGQP